MLTPDEIEDIITDLSCRNAAGGIYTGSVHPFARAIEKAAEAAAIERCAELIDGMNDRAGDRASYDNREMYEGESERMNALSDSSNAIRALLPKEE